MANQTDKKRFTNTLLKFFNITVAKDKTTKDKTVQPARTIQNKNGDDVLRPIKFPDDVQKAYDFFLSNYTLYNSNAHRHDRYKQLEFMIRNEGVMWTACTIYAEETYETKDGQKAIEITAKEKKVEKVFYAWLDAIGFNNNILSELAWNISLYADAFWLNNIDVNDGVVGIVPLDPYIVRDRIEFNVGNANKVKEYLSTYNYANKYNSLKDITDIIENELYNTDYVYYFQSYLLGFEIGLEGDEGKGLPPWAITHFRRFSSKSEFFPFGRPIFLGSLARYQSYKTTELIIDMARSAMFPKEVYEIKANEDLDPLAVTDKVNMVRMHIENITRQTRNRDDLTIREPIYTVENLYSYKLEDSRIDLDKLGDLEHKWNDLLLSTGIPDTILQPSRGSGLGGENATAIMYNNKVFQRRVETNKSAILEGITDTFRLHLAITDDFQGENTVFELSMPVNSDMYSSDKIRQEQDLLRLAKDMVDNMGTALGLDRGEAMPEPLVRDIFKYYIPVDADLVDDWFDEYNKLKEPIKEEKKKSALERFNENIIREIYFQAKESLGLTQTAYGSRYYFNNSYKKLDEFHPINLVKKEIDSKTTKLVEMSPEIPKPNKTKAKAKAKTKTKTVKKAKPADKK